MDHSPRIRFSAADLSDRARPLTTVVRHPPSSIHMSTDQLLARRAAILAEIDLLGGLMEAGVTMMRPGDWAVLSDN